jgi:hypothetical protein
MQRARISRVQMNGACVHLRGHACLRACVRACIRNPFGAKFGACVPPHTKLKPESFCIYLDKKDTSNGDARTLPAATSLQRPRPSAERLHPGHLRRVLPPHGARSGVSSVAGRARPQ